MINKTDLHVHLLQSLYPEDLYELAKDHYKEINWNRFGFLDRYEKIFGKRLDPVEIFNRAVKTESLDEIKQVAVYKYKKDGNFDEFNITSFFPLCITGFYFDRDEYVPVLERIVERQKKEGLSYVEFRHGFFFSYYEEWKDWNLRFARYLKSVSDENFQAKYILRISEEIYPYAIQMMKEHPDIWDVIVGVDFTGSEISPDKLKEFYLKVEEDHKKDPNSALDVVVHIGETFYDKSIESAIRWCHQSALFGAKRLAHCIALGIDPEVAVNRREDAHRYETVEERINQIQYDLKHIEDLLTYGIDINQQQLEEELSILNDRKPDELLFRDYDKKRIEEIKKRQDYALMELKRLGTVIETCPTSNLCIGGLPSIDAHPFKKLYDSGVNLAICTDDPGVFNITLKHEIDLVLNLVNITEVELVKRLGNPYRFRLKDNRN